VEDGAGLEYMKLSMAAAWGLFLTGGAWAQGRPAVVDTSIATVANLPSQTLRANDLLAVSVYNSPELTRTVRVGSDGRISLPMLQRRIQAGGMMPNEMESSIAEELKAEEILVNPLVTVTVIEYNSRPISVIGAVRKPITFQAVGRVTLVDALAKAEGLTPDAGPEVLLSIPQPADAAGPRALLSRIPVRGLIDNADASLNLVLTGGEEIRVPEARKIYVVGNVKKPGAFAVHDGSENTVLKLLAIADGLAPYASKQAYIYRQNGDDPRRVEIAVPLTRILERKSEDMHLAPDDILYIPDAKSRRAGLTALEKVLIYGSGAMSAFIYAGVR
jgi:polysaccharide biosynthesis/export protein